MLEYKISIGNGATVHSLKMENLRLVLSNRVTKMEPPFSRTYTIQTDSFESPISKEDFEQVSSKMRTAAGAEDRGLKFIAVVESLLSLSIEDRSKLLSFVNEMILFATKNGFISGEKAAELKEKIAFEKPAAAEATPLKDCSFSDLVIKPDQGLIIK